MMSEDTKLSEFFQEIFDAFMDRNPTYATFLGYKHEKYDHLLPNGSLKAAEEELELFFTYKKRLANEINYSELTVEGKLDFDLLSFFLEYQNFNANEIAFWRSGASPGNGKASTSSGRRIRFTGTSP